MGTRLADTFEKMLKGEYKLDLGIEDELNPEFKDSLNDSEIIDAEFSEIKEQMFIFNYNQLQAKTVETVFLI